MPPDETAASRPADASPWPALSGRAAAWVVLAWTLVMTCVSVFAHPTPLYLVETDLIGEYLPAARELASGVVTVSHFAYKGPCYPLLLAALSPLFHGDVGLAARVLGPIAAGLAAGLAFAIARLALGPVIATFTLLAMLAMPAQVRYAVEAGTDAPALALMLASTWLVLRQGGTPSRLLAGLVAGLAILTRTNAVFLLPCAAIVLALRPPRVQMLAAYALGAALPLALWSVVAARAGGLPPDRNYLNVAWELYGHGVRWEQFETEAGARFHSLLDVLRYDPLRAAIRIARNLVMFRVSDARDLVTPWLAVLTLPGLILMARRSAARAWLMHAAACALVLAPVFYNARFGLYLVPVYAAAAGVSLAWLVSRARDLALAPWPGRAAALAAAAVVVASGVSAATGVHRLLANAPHEVRLAGEALARLHVSNGSNGAIVARKPHVAYFAGMRHVPFPTDPPLSALPAWAHDNHARYLFFSGLEQVMRPGYAILADSALALPGFHQVLWHRLDADHFYAVYRLDDVSPDSAAFAAAYHAALMRYEANRPGSPAATVFVAIQLLATGEPREALARLDRVKGVGADGAAIDRLRATALLATGELDAAAAAYEEAMRKSTATGSDWAQLGEIHGQRRRFREARDAFAKAVEIEGANTRYLEMLGRIEIQLADYPAAAAAFERRVQLDPADVEARRLAMGAWQLAGNDVRVRQLFTDGVRAGASPAGLAGASPDVRPDVRR